MDFLDLPVAVLDEDFSDVIALTTLKTVNFEQNYDHFKAWISEAENGENFRAELYRKVSLFRTNPLAVSQTVHTFRHEIEYNNVEGEYLAHAEKVCSPVLIASLLWEMFVQKFLRMESILLPCLALYHVGNAVCALDSLGSPVITARPTFHFRSLHDLAVSSHRRRTWSSECPAKRLLVGPCSRN